MATKRQSTAASKSGTTTTKANSGRRTRSGEIKLDLACGDRKAEGFIGVDKYKTPSVDKVVDLLKFPWPWADNSVYQINCSHFFEHIPGELRPKFMEEVYRILQKGKSIVITVPYGNSVRAVQDFTHAWPPVVAESFLYFNKKWREENKLTHGPYALKCDFDFGYGYALDKEWVVRSHDAQAFAMRHYLNVASDLQVTLSKR